MAPKFTANGDVESDRIVTIPVTAWGQVLYTVGKYARASRLSAE